MNVPTQAKTGLEWATYDFVVWSQAKIEEKIRYMHYNPVQRGLVQVPEQWRWSSGRDYILGETGPVLLNEQAARRAEVENSETGHQSGTRVGRGVRLPTLRKARRMGQPR